MSQATSWFIANVVEAALLATDDDPYVRWPSLRLPGILQLELKDLNELVLGQRYSPSLLGEFDGILVLLVPDPFIEALARLTDDNLQTYAGRWRERSEHLFDRSPDEVAASLRDLRNFAQRARKLSTPILDLNAL